MSTVGFSRGRERFASAVLGASAASAGTADPSVGVGAAAGAPALCVDATRVDSPAGDATTVAVIVGNAASAPAEEMMSWWVGVDACPGVTTMGGTASSFELITHPAQTY